MLQLDLASKERIIEQLKGDWQADTTVWQQNMAEVHAEVEATQASFAALPIQHSQGCSHLACTQIGSGTVILA